MGQSGATEGRVENRVAEGLSLPDGKVRVGQNTLTWLKMSIFRYNTRDTCFISNEYLFCLSIFVWLWISLSYSELALTLMEWQSNSNKAARINIIIRYHIENGLNGQITRLTWTWHMFQSLLDECKFSIITFLEWLKQNALYGLGSWTFFAWRFSSKVKYELCLGLG